MLNPHKVGKSAPCSCAWCQDAGSHPGSRFGPAESLQVYQCGCRADESKGPEGVKEAVLALERVKCWGM